MKNISTGTGLVVLGLGIALHPLVAGLVAQATAAPPSPSASAAAAVASATTAQAGPTVVWMAVTSIELNGHSQSIVYHRLWSDGRMECRRVNLSSTDDPCFGYMPLGCSTPWIEVPPPPGGNGFACRTDINGDRLVDGADLSFVLNAWGQQGGCEPDATYPCLDLGNLAGGVALK
jgi:hypothetical protein